MFLLPIGFVVMGLAGEALWRSVRMQHWPRQAMLALLLAGSAALVFDLVRSVPLLDTYYLQEMEAGRSNQGYLQWGAIAINGSRTCHRVLIGRQLDQVEVVKQGSSYGTALDYLSRMNGLAPIFASVPQLEASLSAAPERPAILMLERGEFEQMRRDLSLSVIDDKVDRVIALYPRPNAPCPG